MISGIKYLYEHNFSKAPSYCINGKVDDKSVMEFSELDNPIQDLICAAIEARKNAHCPYSRLPIGAAVKVAGGDIYTGCNVENSSLSASLCAERVAVAAAIANGHRDFSAIAVVGQQENGFVTPCGMCLQFFTEFCDGDTPIYAAKPINPPLRVLCTSILDLLPRRGIIRRSED